MKFATTILLSSCLLAGVANAGVSNIQVTLRGKKYTISEEVETVAEIEAKMRKLASGVEGRLLFGAKRLNSQDILSDVGMEDGSSLNMVPGSKKKKSSTTSKPATTSASSADTTSTTGMPDMSSLLGNGGQGDGSNGSSMPNMEESVDMMTNMMNSPLFKEYMSDPEKLEQSRQMILQNPMMRQMMVGMPGMEELLESPEAWREAMTAAANLYEQMDANDLKQAMMGQVPESLQDMVNDVGKQDAAPAALDELSEGED